MTLTEDWLEHFWRSKVSGERLCDSIFWRLAIHQLPIGVDAYDPAVIAALDEIETSIRGEQMIMPDQAAANRSAMPLCARIVDEAREAFGDVSVRYAREGGVERGARDDADIIAISDAALSQLGSLKEFGTWHGTQRRGKRR